MYKAKCNISCGKKYFEAGVVYTKKEIDGLDINDFEVIKGEENIEEKPKSLTTKNFKAKTKK
jgi:hypothetical protein